MTVETSSPRRRSNRVAVLAAALGILAVAGAGAAPAAPAVRIASPAPGATLASGETALLEWTADEPLPPRIEEWEAFLSLDGGRTYPIRLTPHLDRAISRFLVRVPDVPTDRARLLLRFGDERHETEVDAGFDVVIAPSGASAALAAVAGDLAAIEAPLARNASAGEPARAGDSGTVSWVEGPRDGSTLRTAVARAAAFAASGDPRLLAGRPGPGAATLPRAPEAPRPPLSGTPLAFQPSPPLSVPAAGDPLAGPVAERLALLVRRNT